MMEQEDLTLPNHVRFRASALSELTYVSDARWAALSGVASVAFRPPDRWTDSFAEHGMTTLADVAVFCMRYQGCLFPDMKKAQRSVVLQVFKFAYDVYSGRVYIDAKQNDECSAAVFDCAIPRHKWGEYRHHLNPATNKTAADLALAMDREANRVLDAGEPIPHQPTLPEFYLAFERKPICEKGALLRREASSAFGKAPDEVTDEELEEFFRAQSFEWGSYILAPQRHFARQGEYLAHPVDGSRRPDNEGVTGNWQGLWYFGDGRWSPAAQRPAHVYAHMGNVLGRTFRNPAFTVLKANSFIPVAMTYPQFMATPDIDGLHQKFVDAIEANATVGELLVASMRQVLGRTGDLASDDDLKMALDRPDRPLNLSYATGVKLVRYVAPRADAMTWQFQGGYVDLFNPKRVWEERVRPADLQPVGSTGHGRASAAHAR
jgi:hypothetical protein